MSEALPDAGVPCVYLLRCADGSLYCGWTNRLAHRLAQHERGVASRYTRARLPLELAWWEVCADDGEARRREAAVKGLTRAEKLALVTSGPSRGAASSSYDRPVPAGRFRLIGPDGKPHETDTPGTLGGNRRTRIYGRLDCPTALRHIARGGYVTDRVFFAGAADAVAAGYRPCARCLPDTYAAWKAAGATRR